MGKLIEAIQREFATKSKSDKWTEARWRIILKILRHRRLTIAVFGHKLRASFLALSSAEALDKKAAELESMTPESFKQFMAGRQEKHQDPEVSSPNKTDAQNPSTAVPESEDALSEASMPEKDVV